MKKQLIPVALSCLLLASCSQTKTDVIKLDYIDAHWRVSAYSADNHIILEEAHETLSACTGPLTTDLSGDLTVLDTVVAGRTPISMSVNDNAYKRVTYVKGDQFYAVCQDSISERLRAEVIPSFPDYVDTENGIRIECLPSVRPGDEFAKESLRNEENLKDNGNEVTPFFDSLIQFSPAFHGEIEIRVAGRAMLFPLLAFEPAMVGLGQTDVAIGYNEADEMPYILLSYGNGYFTMIPLEISPEIDESKSAYHELKVERIPLEGELVPGTRYPVYEFTYDKNGAPVMDIVTIEFNQNELVSENTPETDQASQVNPWLNLDEEPNIYLHKEPFDGVAVQEYPFILNAAGIKMDDLVQAIDAAKPSKRSGNEGEYRWLTLIDGLKGQEFKVTYKQRSKKMDVFLTDKLTDETYKLTSEGAETFLSYFPELKSDVDK
ncbi:hypothetical protein EVJ27_07860 [Exiguobacterium sp. SH3S2]|uniref:hypothetical protein n=1 Tax=unclassified Exiguobacterium TaxID=2644629 RepID=UPI00103CB90E|nr:MULTISPECIES: hypothetical protein [unclassified Exiguobacterium]TCI45773.1 hypothetical protein EVJ28_07860 [Exiguobacterium sp. SH3S3]TCI60982.1 hypothetical protein EVJ27_07860 [Exiguobacterium sp. SH3S2]